MTLWNKLRTWIGTIPLTILLIIVVVILVFILRAPVTGFISSIQGGLRKWKEDEKGSVNAAVISEENKSVVPENPKNYQALAKESNDSTAKVLAMLDDTLEALKNAKTNP